MELWGLDFERNAGGGGDRVEGWNLPAGVLVHLDALLGGCGLLGVVDVDGGVTV